MNVDSFIRRKELLDSLNWTLQGGHPLSMGLWAGWENQPTPGYPQHTAVLFGGGAEEEMQGPGTWSPQPPRGPPCNDSRPPNPGHVPR